MNTKRKIKALILCTIIALYLVSCGKDNTGNLVDKNQGEVSSTSISSVDTEANGGAEDSSAQADWALKINTTTLDDEIITTADFKDNKLTVLNIWATWCPPCVSELPHLQEVSQRFNDKDVEIVGVLQDGIIEVGVLDNEIIAAAKTLLSSAGAEYKIILPDETIMLEFIDQMQYFPTTFFINEKGEVIETIVGSKNADEWEDAINEVLQSIS